MFSISQNEKIGSNQFIYALFAHFNFYFSVFRWDKLRETRDPFHACHALPALRTSHCLYLKESVWCVAQPQLKTEDGRWETDEHARLIAAFRFRFLIVRPLWYNLVLDTCISRRWHVMAGRHLLHSDGEQGSMAVRGS